jgi:CheY-like chemotaxis protein
MPRVLVIEDDAWIAWMIADDLADRGYEVSRARDGAEALRRLQPVGPDAIVLDLMLPKINGWDFVERYQERTGGRVIPIVVVSAAGAAPRSLERKGVRHFLSKPFDVEELARSVADALASTEHAESITMVVPAGGTTVRLDSAASRNETPAS